MSGHMNGNRSGGRLQYMALALACALSMTLAAPHATYAKSAKEIEASVDVALERFRQEVKGAKELLDAAKGILVLPGVLKAGFVFGGEYGEGALRVGGRTVEYYSMAAGSWGIQIGAQKKDVILIFMTDEALEDFRKSSGWKAGVDGSVAMIESGAGGALDTKMLSQPIIGFVFGQKGLMVNATVEGSKFSKLDKSEELDKEKIEREEGEEE
jgi:lipid-binding SYLF domain-containing protein